MKIQTLTLYTSSLKNQLSFYRDTLGFEVLETNDSNFTLKTGSTRLTFISSENATPYHFAFNIPAYHEQEALNWLKQRVSIIKDEDLEIMEFEDWQAKAVYFYDADHNIVEFISRQKITTEVPLPFTIQSVLSISEIGLVTDNIEPVYQKLDSLGVDVFDGNMHRFCAAGDDSGLFIIIDPNLKKWFPTGEKAYYSPFVIEIEIGENAHRLNYKKNELQLK
jgi:catechol-2,3-dioxygenase